MKSEKNLKVGTVAKLPQVQYTDNGTYVCKVHPWGNSSNAVFAFNVDVIVDGETEEKSKSLEDYNIFCCCVDGVSWHQCQKIHQQH